MRKFFTATPPSITSTCEMALDLAVKTQFNACNSKNLSRNLPVQLFISISCSIVSEKLANRGIVWLSNGKGGGLPGNTEAPLLTCLHVYAAAKYVYIIMIPIISLHVYFCIAIGKKHCL